MNRITQHILLGGCGDVEHLDDVQGVINCTPIRELDYEWPSHVDYARVPVFDEEEIDERYFRHAMEELAQMVTANKQILIHCMGGVSRSPSFLACYLSLSLRISPQEALDYIKTQRYGVDPHKDVWDSVIEYVREHWSDPPLPRSERV